ncbi:hypothetical protein PoB_004458200 [Plakobranchus ocellatus]|uniref:Uncharacterized protein n=1 Tax=Plakobranchus ocellatus TaxID=259542 RepID=A0AAV4BGI5_9GAST|nr:hypothetical protein PoB_004458200 [Plakobranchus ocellatus]
MVNSYAQTSCISSWCKLPAHYKVIPSFKALLKCAVCSPAGIHEIRVSAKAILSSLANEPPRTCIDQDLNGILKNGAILQPQAPHKPKTLLLPTSVIIATTARSHASKRTDVDKYALQCRTKAGGKRIMSVISLIDSNR